MNSGQCCQKLKFPLKNPFQKERGPGCATQFSVHFGGNLVAMSDPIFLSHSWTKKDLLCSAENYTFPCCHKIDVVY